YPSLNSLSICELPFDATPCTPLPNLQVHKRLPLRMVPHKQPNQLRNSFLQHPCGHHRQIFFYLLQSWKMH
ncbi:hypothetical protein K443DRAFT_113454, partial [Laccaria amethystina LaAM-08-1]